MCEPGSSITLAPACNTTYNILRYSSKLCVEYKCIMETCSRVHLSVTGKVNAVHADFPLSPI